MRQYLGIKEKHPDAVLLFRVGDFYEAFGPDAQVCSKILGIVLTKRSNGSAADIPLAGFPYHALDTYLPKLVTAGKRVAICDQLEAVSPHKKLVKRGVTELLSPGVRFHEGTISERSNTFLCCLHPGTHPENWGIAFLDVSTGSFFCAEGSESLVHKLLESFAPGEILLTTSLKRTLGEELARDYYVYYQEGWLFDHDFLYEKLTRHFQTQNLKGFGIETLKSGIICCGIILNYISQTYKHQIKHITGIQRINDQSFVWMDKFTIRSLELLRSLDPKGHALLDVLDHTVTPMGSRLLKLWLHLPLKNEEEINQRLTAVSHLKEEKSTQEDLRSSLTEIADLERLSGKLARRNISPRDFNLLKQSLESLARVKDRILKTEASPLKTISDQIILCQALLEKITQTIQDEAPVHHSKGAFIRLGCSDELDSCKGFLTEGKAKLEDLRQQEIDITGVSNLKVGFNNVFGYYFEISHRNADKIPPHRTRKQTLKGGERYVSEPLKDLEQHIRSAKEKVATLEMNLFEELISFAQDFIAPLQSNTGHIATLDCLLGFALVAEVQHYHRPEINASTRIDIRQGRHPVIEKHLKEDRSYIANDTLIDPQSQQILMITGPNMSGKSAYLRQTALIVIMAQIGCFVPAEKASIGIADKIFSRVGASDNISSGESTFMVEMTETAAILNNLSQRSLILMDEIGRGTGTHDGVSIARSVATFLHQHPLRPKTLFATHYHEMAQLNTTYPRIKNCHISVKRSAEQIIFLRKVLDGAGTRSFGIYVARLAGVPKAVIEDALHTLQTLEREQQNRQATPPTPTHHTTLEALKAYRTLDTDTLTPVDALLKLSHILRLIRELSEGSLS